MRQHANEDLAKGFAATLLLQAPAYALHAGASHDAALLGTCVGEADQAEGTGPHCQCICVSPTSGRADWGSLLGLNEKRARVRAAAARTDMTSELAW